MQGTLVRSLAWKDPHATEQLSPCSPGMEPTWLEPVPTTRGASAMRNARITTAALDGTREKPVQQADLQPKAVNLRKKI